MSNLDQCPSSKGKEEIPTKAPELGTVSGRKFWRSLDEYSGTPEFKEFVEREFPAGASILGEPSRRNFVKIMGAGFALAGAATIPGCRRPDRKILPYSQTPPEEVIPGKPLYFTTALPLRRRLRGPAHRDPHRSPHQGRGQPAAPGQSGQDQRHGPGQRAQSLRPRSPDVPRVQQPNPRQARRDMG